MLQKLFTTLNSRRYFVYKKCCSSVDSDQKVVGPCFLCLQRIWGSKIGNLIAAITVKCGFFFVRLRHWASEKLFVNLEPFAV